MKSRPDNDEASEPGNHGQFPVGRLPSGLRPVRRRSRPMPIARPVEPEGREPSRPDDAPISPDLAGADQAQAPDRQQPASDYPVGYKRPPNSHKFKKGESGNPKGRPRESKSMKSLFDAELASTVSFREGGRTRKASKRQIIVKRTVNKAAEGDPKATEAIFRVEGIAQRPGRGVIGGGEPGTADPRQAEIDREIVEAYFKMAREAPEDWQQPSNPGDKDDDR